VQLTSIRGYMAIHSAAGGGKRKGGFRVRTGRKQTFACALIFLLSPCGMIAVLASPEATVCLIYHREQLAETGRLLHQSGSSKCWPREVS
jgi:hypothetical protein